MTHYWKRRTAFESINAGNQNDKVTAIARRYYHKWIDAGTDDAVLFGAMAEFSAAVTKSQAAKIADLELTRDVHEKQMWEDAMTIKRLTGEVKGLRERERRLLQDILDRNPQLVEALSGAGGEGE